MRFLKKRSAQLKLYQQPDTESPLPLTEQPVLRYSNWAGSSSDGATFLWLHDERPVAVGKSRQRGAEAVDLHLVVQPAAAGCDDDHILDDIELQARVLA